MSKDNKHTQGSPGDLKINRFGYGQGLEADLDEESTAQTL